MAGIFLMVASSAAAASACEPSAATNRQIVTDFYRQALIDKQPGPAFARYMAPDFVEHKPDVPHGTREATAAFLGELIKAMPDPKWEVLRVVAEGDLVALHARFTPAAGAPADAIADVLRLYGFKIVVPLDALGGPPENAKNPKPRF
jgi:predicted SnoaL-like aldol condensation-catalyzing enzyme